MVLVIVDAHSKYIDAHIVNAATSSATITKLRQTFATHGHGLPSVLVSDNATCFKSSEFEEFCRLNGIQHVTSAPLRPASNGAAERAVQTVKAGLRKTEGRDMETRLYRFLLHYRDTPQTTTGQAPAELLMGRKPRTRMHLVQPDIKDIVLRKQGKECDSHTSSTDYTFYAGDAVWAMNFAGTPKWQPGVLEEKTGPVSYTVRLADGRVWRRHCDHLRKRLPAETEGTELDQWRHLQQPVLLPPRPTNRTAPTEEKRPEEKRTVETNTEVRSDKDELVTPGAVNTRPVRNRKPPDRLICSK